MWFVPKWTIPAPGEKGSETWPNKDKPDEVEALWAYVTAGEK